MRIKLILGNGIEIVLIPNEITTALTLTAATPVSGGYVLDQYVSLDMLVPSGGYKDGYSVHGFATTAIIWGAATCTYIQGINVTVQFGTWYCDGVNCTHATAGPSGDYQIYGVHTQIDGVDFYGLATTMPAGFSGSIVCLMSEGAIGKSGFADPGGPHIPPGTGYDANGGWGVYDYTNPTASGSSVPSTPSMPISETGYGMHAYTLDDDAYKVLGAAMWGIGDAAAGMGVADLWTAWKNYRYSPLAGIISCIRLPAAFTPSRTDIADSNIKIAGTWAAAGGQFASITGCKPADCTPIAQTVLTADIPEQYGSYLDYAGGIEITLYLPFCGKMQIDPSACVGGGINVVYVCDPCNGNCASIVSTTDRFGYTQVYGSATGNCALQTPVIGHSDGQIQMLGSLVGDAVSIAGSAAAGSPVGVVGGITGAASSILLRREMTQTVGSSVGSVNYVNNVEPTLIISYAHPTNSPNYNHVNGRPCEYGATVGDYSGFTVFRDIDVDIAGATAEECSEIKQLLESGVIL